MTAVAAVAMSCGCHILESSSLQPADARMCRELTVGSVPDGRTHLEYRGYGRSAGVEYESRVALL